MPPGLAIPKPWVLGHDVAPTGDTVAIRLTLFGSATGVLQTASDALVAALRGGLTHGGDAAGRVPLEVLDRVITFGSEAAHGAEALSAAAPQAVSLAFSSPVVLRRDGHAGLDVVSLLTGLGNRISGLARWMGVAVHADWRALRADAEALTVTEAEMQPVRWRRRSNRQGREIPMHGFVGHLSLSGPLDSLMPLLVLGTETHCGSHAALGLGRYALEVSGSDGVPRAM